MSLTVPHGFPMLLHAQLKEKLQAVKLFIMDVDGVLTDGGLIFDDQGQQYKRFHSRDGLGIRMLQDTGVETALITGRRSDVVLRRAEELQITHIFQGARAKLPAFEELREALKLDYHEVAFIGDDIIDLPVMSRVGAALTVADAHPLVRQRADWASQHKGGHGAAREACEIIMQAQGTLQQAMAAFLA